MKKEDIIDILKKSIIFKNIDKEKIDKLLKEIKYKINTFNKSKFIAIEEDECTSLGIVIYGKIEVQKIFASGKAITIDRLNQGEIFGEVIIFSNMNTYPASIVATEKSEILFISKDQILKLFNLDSKALNNFMGLLSNKILMLNRKVKNLSYHSIREKVSNFILEEYKKQQNCILKLNVSRKEMAEYLGIPRPSLSREMLKMKEEGIIDFNKNIIEILNEGKLEGELV
ncbi:Crp/Fnr family transcriptional regulator [Clostridium rectalis]|uniref:Crp/Fnr family transcriptional regulator n=1 Tax=Clostridium rectalis TaxID=2040295 RepID=UPI000F6418B5|nr:Crp/Fnr family transcriptional regulator [Clostridium rectalis]